MQITYVADHKRKAVEEELLSQFAGKPRITALIKALAQGVQYLEDMQFDLATGSTLTAATGRELDLWGQLVDERRLGLDDDSYRAVIQTKIRALRTNGTIDDLVDIFKALTDADEVRYFHHYPAGYRLTAYRDEPMSDERVRRVKRIMELCRPAGVGMVLAEAVTTSTCAAFDKSGRGFGSSLSRTL